MSQELTLSVFEKKGVVERMTQVGMKKADVLREISFSLQIIGQNPDLKDGDPIDILEAVANLANMGLTLNPAAKEAYLISRYNRKLNRKKITLEPGYIGLINLAIRAGGIKSMTVQTVYEGDDFRMNIADNGAPIFHSPCLAKSKRGEALGVYALATLPDGSRQVEWMDIEEVREIRDRSESWKAYNEGKIKTCIWLTDFSEMSRKTVVKRIVKYLPKGRGPMQEALQYAIQADNEDYSADTWQLLEIEQLSKAIDDNAGRLLESELRGGMTRDRANQVIYQLRDMQPPNDPRYGNDSPTAAKKALEKLH